MNSFVMLTRAVAIIFPFVTVGVAQAASPLDVAQQFLHDLTAYQVISKVHNEQSHMEWVSETEVVRDGALHIREISDGKLVLEAITDGKREFLRNEQGRYEEVHGDAAGALAEWQEAASLGSVIKHADGPLHPMGHEIIDGIATSVYLTTIGEWTTLPETIQVWIADKDHRPLKIERELKGVAVGLTNQACRQTASIVFRYDPAIKVTLPAE